MATNYPKFDNKIQNQIDLSRMRQAKTRPGVIMQFDKKSNLATIILDDAYSGQVGNIISSVPCPAIMGVQNVAPEPGTRCLVGFRDDNENKAYVISYFEESNLGSNYSSNYTVNTGIPKFMAR
jgi:hypothetical protein